MPSRAWEAAEDEILRQVYPEAEHILPVLAALPGRSERAIASRACRLGISKSEPVRRAILQRVKPIFGVGFSRVGRGGAGSLDRDRDDRQGLSTG